MKATFRGRVIADSAQAVEVDGYWYFPRAAVQAGLLTAAAKTPADAQCPHGVQFYDVGQGRERAPRSAWSYERPGAAMQRVGGWIGFWDAVEVAG